MLVVDDERGGREAVAAIRREAPDVVFLDVQMPDLSGLDVVREVGPASMPVTPSFTPATMPCGCAMGRGCARRSRRDALAARLEALR